MRVRVLHSIKDSSGWIQPGTIREFSDEEARRLFLLRAAEPISTPSDEKEMESDGASDEDDSDEESYTDEELAALAEALFEIDGVNNDIAYRLIEAGFVDCESVAEADPSDLVKIKGIGNKNVGIIQESAEDVFDSSDKDDDADNDDD